MPEGNAMSVGNISLDLVIRNKIGQQLDKIKQNVSANAENIGRAIEAAIEKPMETAGKAAADTVSKAMKKAEKAVSEAELKMPEPDFTFDGAGAVRDLDDLINDALNKQKRSVDVEITPRVDTRSGSDYVNYDRNKIAKEIEALELEAAKAAERAGKKAKAPVDSVTKALKDAESAFSDFENQLSSSNGRLEAQLLNLTAKYERLKQKWVELAGSDYDSPQLVSLEAQIISTANTIDKLQEKINKTADETTEKVKEKLAEIGKYNISAEPAERLRQEIELVNTQMDLLQKKWQELSAAEPSDKINSELLSVEKQIISTQNKLDRLRSKMSDLSTPVAGPVTEHIDEAIGKTSRAADRAGKRIKKSFGSAFGHITSVGGKATSALSRRFAVFSRSAGAAVKPVVKLGTALKNTFRRVFLMAGIYAAFRSLKEGLSEAAEANEEFSKSLNDVKANLAIAFTPILQAIMPALNTLMSGLAAVTKQIAGFIAGLFGMTYKQAAEATKKLKATTDAAKKAKLALAGIDEMNILSSDDDDSKSNSIDFSDLDMSEPKLPDWAERLKEAIKAGDWNGVGKLLADRVNAALDIIDWDAAERKAVAGVSKICDGINGFIDNINWHKLGENIAGGINTVTAVINTLADKIHWENLGRNIAKGLNSAIAKIKWGQLGRALAAKIRILTDLLYGFVTEFNWENLGKGIGEAVNGWFSGIDFGKIGKTVSEGLKGIFATVSAVLRTVRFRDIGSRIADLINNIDIAGILSKAAETLSYAAKAVLDLAIGIFENTDWSRLGKQIISAVTGVITAIDWSGIIRGAFELLGAAIGAQKALAESLYQKIFELLAGAWDTVKNYFQEKIEECGGNIISGVFKGIRDALADVGTWIKNNIFTPFMDGFKKAFGIHSPSKVMATMGGYIIDGLYNGIANGIKRIKEIFTEMRGAIETVFERVPEWFGEKFTAAYERIKDAFRFIGSWFSEKFADARSKVNATFIDIGIWFGQRWTDITSALADVGKFFSDTFSGARSKTEEAFRNIGGWFKERCDAVKTGFGDIGDWFRDKFQDAYNNITSIFNGITDFFSGIWSSMREGAVGGINDIIEKIEEGINYPIEALMGQTIHLPKILGGDISLGDKLDFIHLPRLASGGLATAPTLAMVGDNRNALSDPEVISPLSKLQGMIDSGSSAESVELLREILALLRSGLSAELIGTIFGSDFKRTVLKIVADDKARRGTV